MECEYIEIRGVPHGFDPVNVQFFDSVDNVLAILKSEGFVEVDLENLAVLKGRTPDVSLGKPLIRFVEKIMAEVVRYHVRLWVIETNDGVVGNVHVDIPTPIGHVAVHEWGRNYIVEIFLRHGYWVTYEKCEPKELDKFDGYVAKIYKEPCKKKT